MAELVLGIGTSHSPMLTIPSDQWVERGKDDLRRKSIALTDGRSLSYEDLSAEVRDRYAGQATPKTFAEQHRRAQLALDRLAVEIAEAAPDVVVIIGDDQDELFGVAHLPSLAVYYGAELVMHPKNEVTPNLPEWYRIANTGYLMDKPYSHPASPELATDLIVGLMEEGIDVASAAKVENAVEAGFGHAYGFIIQRLFGGRAIPVLPVMLNTYFPPNVPRPWRCHDIGRAIARVLRAHKSAARVAIVASGGLSHFHTDSELDERILAAFKSGDANTLRTLPMAALRSGSSEILNWVMAAGALEDLKVAWSEYLPVYRTPAGTGCGLGFVTWRQAGSL